MAAMQTAARKLAAFRSYRVGAGARAPHADTFTVQIGVPEPSTWALLLTEFGTLGLIGYRRSRKAQAAG